MGTIFNPNQFWKEVFVFITTILLACFVIMKVIFNSMVDVDATCQSRFKIWQSQQDSELTKRIRLEVFSEISQEILELQELPIDDPRRLKITRLENELELLGGGKDFDK